MLDQNTIERLNVPLDPSRVSQFTSGPQQGVNYLEGHDVIRTANEIFGYGQWGFEPLGQPWVIESGVQGQKGTPYQVWACMARLTVAGCEPITEIGTNTRSGDGAAGLEMAIKGAVTDALKRCLRMFGDQFGLILYDKDMAAQNAAIEAWHNYQQSHTDQRQTPPPAPPRAPTSAPVAHIDPNTDEPTPRLLTRREVEAECQRWNLGINVVGAFIKQQKVPTPISESEFAEYASSQEGRLMTDPAKLVRLSLNYIKNNVPEGPFRDTAIEAMRSIRQSMEAQP